MPDRRQRLAAARLYLVCDARPDGFLQDVLRGGVDIVQLRIKDGEDGEIVAVARRYAGRCAERGALLILNDRPDLVVAADADGVHVGQDDIGVAQARALVGAHRLVGLSTHSPAQIDAAADAGVDYIGVGPVHATPTKPGRPAVGLELVRYAAGHAVMPFFAIGGIDAGNAGAVRSAGAARIAVVRALTDATDPERAARALRAALTPADDHEARVGAA
ncbi:MAG: thiamine phosphate synthase [Solirubrobacteraceae bacterium]